MVVALDIKMRALACLVAVEVQGGREGFTRIGRINANGKPLTPALSPSDGEREMFFLAVNPG